MVNVVKHETIAYTLELTKDEAQVLRVALGGFETNSPTSPLFMALLGAGVEKGRYYFSKDQSDIPIVKSF